ncbi:MULTISPECIES: phosphoadenylyl-sulfate reductase [Thermoactinomyces]|jgi:phosphoadenosine phosphosulfate reductase|uniref:Adenosine 5'-phosphosulfate reductase n=1 Tax=Thermoactinomyces daqus TaxID=1329516 RepID=A0A7W1XBK7_9BACL|nr:MULTISPECIES: phosphoadenylyl-sulfate reductase [Thermoactinomyces]MBA4543634.1 phosphoadenylyl-sulfate reductase [Thermoactinomyces daqus]MBH8597085.1 phosphoadenylyl-sulfate reductase [Thermoactinomyces sp. CICC 10523]MBH8602645.1 phosphoadenylyl-sulfate reductase [Thermoactinomyces sp. CICC 10522]MBH8606244.1 phosphoadenylyl-sulfate reductase [Thermoactinomyces sp. CICC 10521]
MANQNGKSSVLVESEQAKLEFLQEAAHQLKNEHPIEIIRFGIEQVGVSGITLACSFGAEDVALVDMLLKVDKDVDIFYLDTDLHFAETYEVRDRLKERYQKDFIRVSPALTLEEQAEKYGDELWKVNPDQCCRIRKVEPLKQFLRGYQGWITGIRREQSPTRAHTEVVEWDRAFGLVKINPLAYWTNAQVWEYIYSNDIPYNKLHDQSYPSIGCQPCTRPVKPGEDPRAGRWAGLDKTECGLHNSPVR